MNVMQQTPSTLSRKPMLKRSVTKTDQELELSAQVHGFDPPSSARELTMLTIAPYVPATVMNDPINMTKTFQHAISIHFQLPVSRFLQLS